MTPQLLVATAIRWVGFAALVALVGSMVLRDLVLPRTLGISPTALRLGRLALASAVVLIGASAGDLLVRAQTMAGGDVASAIAATPVVLGRTHFGAIWVARLALLLLVAAALLGRSTAARRAGLALGAAIALTTALTGHAADWGDVTPSAAIDWIHVLAVSAWTGGLFGLRLVVLPDARSWDEPTLGGVMRRFSRLAGACLPVVVASGGYNAWLQLSPPSALWTTAYGRTLLVKVALVAALVWWGALNRYTVVNVLDRRPSSGLGDRGFRLVSRAFGGGSRLAERSAPERLRALVAREALVAALVLGCTAVLADSTPARHADHFEHQATGDPHHGG